jgi:hypothetical protein
MRAILFLEYEEYYSLLPYLFVAVGVRATSLTQFIKNACNICIFK